LAFLKLHGVILLSLGWTKVTARVAHTPARSSTRFRERGDEKKPAAIWPGLLTQF
jgi:hypothetical protein